MLVELLELLPQSNMASAIVMRTISPMHLRTSPPESKNSASRKEPKNPSEVACDNELIKTAQCVLRDSLYCAVPNKDLESLCKFIELDFGAVMG